MKCFILVTLASAVILCGCASTNNSANGNAANSEERYIPLGTLIARKGPSRADNTTTIDKQALENDRIMGGSDPGNRR
ncbi:MAG: hypothetical protein JWQ01_2096 [Massilia sp.]|jgi:hypothetical protein|nr:hypothetical protein [Massilia sp.]